MEYLKAILLAIVEGATEFLPISSTGHLILLEDYLRLSGGDGFAETFMVVIQLPAILAVVVYFWSALWPFGKDKDTRAIIVLWIKIVVAFLPAAVLGVLLDDFIEAKLFNPLTVAIALLIGGIVLIVLERGERPARIPTVHAISYATGIGIGFFQCLAMIPGTSRSAATIIGAMALGASRSAAAEFSFFLAIPTMLGATAYKLFKNGMNFTPHQWGLILVASVVSFAVAYSVVALFMNFIRKHRFTVFGYYRIALALLVLALMLFR